MSVSSVVQAAQEFMVGLDLPGWLIHDFRHSNPIFPQVVTASGHVTRPCFLYLPKEGPGQLLAHFVDAGKFTDSRFDLVVYRNRAAMVDALTRMLSGASSVAMEYSPQNALPRVSRVDAGTVELVRSLGVEVLSSADIGDSPPQRHQQVFDVVTGARDAALKFLEDNHRDGIPVEG